MYAGGCLCGSVRYEIRGELGLSYYCHCSRCRKATGSAFAASALVAAKDFVVLQGEDALKSYSVNGVHRIFCAHCGSPIISRRDAMPDAVRVRLGTIETPLPRGPHGHIYVASKANWFEICDDLPQYAEEPPMS
ncbi:MAG: GFA family protein [Gammaproteobacteria bacterium]|nr:aldehyde-activating protein [Gammaproteobacteria bacterium]